MSGGTFNVSRTIWTHPAFADEPLTEREAFMWMVGEASWKPREVRVGKYVANTDRGQLVASVRFMAEAWDWSKSRVSRFLKRLENRDTIRTESGTGILVITICDYDEFQAACAASGTVAGQSAGQMRDSSGTNEKKDKKDNITPPLSPPAGGKEKRAKRLPEDWHLPKAWGEWAMANVGMTEAQVRTEADQFRDYWHATPGARARKLDWLATWRTWCRRWAESRPTKRAPDRRNISLDEDLKNRGVGRDLEEWARRNADADNGGNFSGGGDHNPSAHWHAADDMPAVLAFPEKENRSVSERDARAGQGAGELLALRMDVCGISR